MPGLALDAALASIRTDISIDAPGSRDRGSDDDPNRREMAWANRLEDLVHHTRKASSASAASHETAAKRARKLYQLFGLPTVVIPLAGSAFTGGIGAVGGAVTGVANEAGGAVGNVTGAAKDIFSSPVLLIGGAAVLLILLSK